MKAGLQDESWNSAFLNWEGKVFSRSTSQAISHSHCCRNIGKRQTYIIILNESINLDRILVLMFSFLTIVILVLFTTLKKKCLFSVSAQENEIHINIEILSVIRYTKNFFLLILKLILKLYMLKVFTLKNWYWRINVSRRAARMQKNDEQNRALLQMD